MTAVTSTRMRTMSSAATGRERLHRDLFRPGSEMAKVSIIHLGFTFS
jgi:hypothetical protein